MIPTPSRPQAWRGLALATLIALPLAACKGQDAPAAPDATADLAAGAPALPNPAAPGAGSSGAEAGAPATAPESGAVAVLPGTDNEVDVATTAALQASGGALLIDVREPEEYAEGHIPGITLIPMSEVQDRLAELPRDQPLVLTCRSGNRSATVAEFLRGQGYDQVYSMQGGIVAWEGAGQPVER